MRRTLREVFGLQALRAGQARAIDRVLGGLSTLLVMPTGAGKSLCYQLPALLLPGRTVVVSPLIALMKDQCESLLALGIDAVQLHSQLDGPAAQAAERAIAEGQARIVLTTPERLADEDCLRLLRSGPVSLVVVDEAHCISSWGHDFRPAFLEIAQGLRALGDPPVLALTATAAEAVAADIREALAIPRGGHIDTGVYRPNLRLAVQPASDDADKRARALAIVARSVGSGIVYAATVRAAVELHAALHDSGQAAALYHGRLPAKERQAAQDAFMEDRVRVMVATNAFGMGIDKPDIRFVLHYQLPGGLDAYYQEAGRAGRDGEPADCTLLFLRRDKAVQQFFLVGRYPQLDDIEAVYRALASPAPAGGWTLEAVRRRVQRPATKVRALLGMLVQRGIAERRRAGAPAQAEGDPAAIGQSAVHLREDAAEPPDLAGLLMAYRDKRTHDHDALERMVFYAQTGQCRWQVLLAGLLEDADAAGTGRCGRCDNCERIAAHEAALAQPVVRAVEAALRPVGPAPSVFGAGRPVRVKRYGKGLVVSADATAVTIEFPDGSQRSFDPHYVSLAGRGLNPAG